jgi:hypothetical protein
MFSTFTRGSVGRVFGSSAAALAEVEGADDGVGAALARAGEATDALARGGVANGKRSSGLTVGTALVIARALGAVLSASLGASVHAGRRPARVARRSVRAFTRPRVSSSNGWCNGPNAFSDVAALSAPRLRVRARRQCRHARRA